MKRFWPVRSTLRVVIELLFLATPAFADLDHATWDQLLHRYVHWTEGGHASVVDYSALSAERPALDRYLAELSAVDQPSFDRWPKEDQLAFLINAYNAFTVHLVLRHYPHLSSIKDLGSLLRSPWKEPFVPLLGSTRSLDNIEHDLIRASPRYREPRVHFAVNCASIGCPALRPEAYVGAKLDAQLEDQAHRFLGDRQRNRLQGSKLIVSPIFKWYRSDFEQGWRGAKSLGAFLALYAADLGLSPAETEALRKGEIGIAFGSYDWRLNDARRQRP